MKQDKQWWAAIWKGLIMDERATHYRSMKSALWLFLYLVLNADRKTGHLSRRISTISADMGIERATILRWLRCLRERGYIQSQSTGRALHIQIHKWKSAAPKMPLQRCAFSHPRGDKNATSHSAPKGSKTAPLSQKVEADVAPNERSLKKGLLKIDIDRKKLFFDRALSYQGQKPKTKQELLACDLARDLGDQEGLPLYLSYAAKYPESLLREVLSTTRQMPQSKIRKSRGALFNYLIQQYASQTSKRSRR